MNGANNDHGGYQPDVSSYDYDAPLDESGRPRPKYFRIRQMIAEVTHTEPVAVPKSPPLITLPAIPLHASQLLWPSLPSAIKADNPPSMEDIGQDYGYILYRTEVKGSGTAELALDEVHSYARVYVDGKLMGILDRRMGTKSMPLELHGKHRLDLLVENSGRINFTMAIRGERAGILGSVRYGAKTLHGWKIFSLPMAEAPSTGYRDRACTGPCFYRAEFYVSTPGDTFLNTEKLGKGTVWVNGHHLGRFWNIGPAGALYLPGAWLHSGNNEIEVFDLNGGEGLTVAGEDHMSYFDPKPESTEPVK